MSAPTPLRLCLALLATAALTAACGGAPVEAGSSALATTSQAAQGDSLPDENGGCPEGKSLVCHVPPGNPDNIHLLCVSPKSWKAHSAHGDSYEEAAVLACPTSSGEPEEDEEEEEEEDEGTSCTQDADCQSGYVCSEGECLPDIQ